ncbi:MAG: hypothetical protein LIP10_07640 [Clostridiales bacterium]|nr:hypothetical protein [Clostridiales bacterium]
MKIRLLQIPRKCIKVIRGKPAWRDDSRCEFLNQEANDFIFNQLMENSNQGLMISKFGTIELNSIVGYYIRKRGITFRDKIDYVQDKVLLYPEETLDALCSNAGFFPKSELLQEKYAELTLNDAKDIDILASYIQNEKYLNQELEDVRRVNLDGFYAPFLWKHPWTRFLKGKKVLIIHPFVESIERQYDNRVHLFSDPDVLPEFAEIYFIEAVQSLGCNANGNQFKDWFQALEFMEDKIDAIDFDVALIGCGAYGMNLAAYIKRKGKIALHLAGWTQMLFGIYGKRWIEDQPQFSGFVNEYWIRPSEKEKPLNYASVEGGCYW